VDAGLQVACGWRGAGHAAARARIAGEEAQGHVAARGWIAAEGHAVEVGERAEGVAQKASQEGV